MTIVADIDVSFTQEGDQLIIVPRGDWTVHTIDAVDQRLRELPDPLHPPVIDLSNIRNIDTAGAFLLDRSARQGCVDHERINIRGDHETARRLLDRVREARDECPVELPKPYGFNNWLARIGEDAVNGFIEGSKTLSFVGETLLACLRIALQPQRLRGTATVSVMESAGLDAIPIIMFLSFFVGTVIAFIGATTLEAFNSTIFTVELVGIAVLREFGVVITAVILAGRTNSAFTAQIGAMRMRQEVDAMQVLGLDPMEVLVAPRVIAMLLMTPILTFLATVAGLFGGLIICWTALDIGPTLFLNRMLDMVPVENFWVGMSKAPFFAMVVALIGCRQGLQVGGSVQSLGESTTNSVVQALFSIIVIDAVFAMFYMQLGI
ncbi:MAG: MlaE family lipid ABC transporter permease subunit [Pseudomonadota bacterium]